MNNNKSGIEVKCENCFYQCKNQAQIKEEQSHCSCGEWIPHCATRTFTPTEEAYEQLIEKIRVNLLSVLDGFPINEDSNALELSEALVVLEKHRRNAIHMGNARIQALKTYKGAEDE